MKKYLIRTALVLAAITACNKEVETPTPVVDNGQEEVASGKVTLTFTATIGEETRTAYAGDKTASWVDGDAISVCVTNGSAYEVDTFTYTTNNGGEFTGQVTSGYTTIVSGVYPANANHVFTNGTVASVYLPDTYNLRTANDTGIALPMLGEMVAPAVGETPVFTFHHICNALKVTLNSIPADADLFTFSTNSQKVSGDFQLSNGRLALVSSQNNDASVSFSFTASTVTQQRSFYIPIPDGQFVAGAYVTVEKTVEDSDNEVLYKKVINSTPTFGPNAQNGHDAIRRLPTVTCWTRNENWNAYYYGSYKTSGVIKKRICLENMTGHYYFEVLNSNTFNNTYHGSVADYLSSSHFSDYVNGLTDSQYLSASSLNLNYSSFSPGSYYVMLFGLDENRKFTGEYNCVEVVYPTLNTPTGWSINVVEDYKIVYTVPSDTKWQYVSVTAADFQSIYLSDLEYLIYKGILDRKGWHEATPTSWAPRTGSQSYTVSYDVDYVLLCIGIDDNYRPTGEYCRLDHSFEAPTRDYLAWIGTWTVSDGTNNDTWKISRRQANQSYNITGIAGQTYRVKGVFDNGALTLTSQLLEEKYGTNQRDLYLLGRNSTGSIHSSYLDRLILTATMDDQGAVTVTPSTSTSPGGYGIYYMVTKWNIRGTRDFSHSISMTKQ